MTKNEFKDRLGRSIKSIRKEKGISLREFEDRSDYKIDRHLLSKIENGKVSPELYTIFRICKILDTDLIHVIQRMDL